MRVLQQSDDFLVLGCALIAPPLELAFEGQALDLQLLEQLLNSLFYVFRINLVDYGGQLAQLFSVFLLRVK